MPDGCTQLLRSDLSPLFSASWSQTYTVAADADASSDGLETEQPEIGEAEALTYVAGWVVRKVSEDPIMKSCAACEKLIHPSNLMRNLLVNCAGKIKKTLPRVWGKRNITKTLKCFLRSGNTFDELDRFHHMQRTSKG